MDGVTVLDSDAGHKKYSSAEVYLEGMVTLLVVMKKCLSILLILTSSQHSSYSASRKAEAVVVRASIKSDGLPGAHSCPVAP